MKWLSNLNRTTLAIAGLAMAAIIVLSVNLISNTALNHVKADLTAEGLFTISSGTGDVLKSIDEPVKLQVYYSKPLGEAAPAYGKYFERVRALLRQYEDIAGPNLEISFLEPAPFSDAEDRAVAAGLEGIRLNQEGDMGYFGLVATNSTDGLESIRFFTPQRERYLEYDLTKLIYKLANPKKRVVGLMTSLPIQGGVSPRRQPLPAWVISDQIADFYEVRKIDLTAKEIPGEVDILLIAHPSGMSDEAVFAVDQFALKGGQVLAFVDPLSEAGQAAQPGPAGATTPASFVKLLGAWGLKFDPARIAGDLTHARRVQFARTGRPVVTEYVSWLGLDKRNLNDGDVLTGGIEQLNLASSGILEAAPDAGTKVTPLVTTSVQSMAIEAAKFRLSPDPVALLRGFQPGGKPLMLAARVTGDAKSAFPDGRPKPKDAGANKDKPETGDGKSTQPLKSGTINAIVVADSDFLHDQFWVSVQNFFGQRLMIPTAHNGTFVLNALENLSGGLALSDLRGRGVEDRPFRMVDDIRRDSERRYRRTEQALLKKLEAVRTELGKIEKKGEGGQAILSEKDHQAIDKFRGEMIAIRRELRSVKLALRQDIDRLDGALKFANIAGVPLLIAVGGLAVGAVARRRRRRAARKS